MASYDYIIVGAGSAGCVLAGRLSENRETSVLLLEAGGPDSHREIRIPAAFSKLFKSKADWNYTTEAQANLHGRQLYWPRGKVIGGSSSINAMIYIRGNALDYDRWESPVSYTHLDVYKRQRDFQIARHYRVPVS